MNGRDSGGGSSSNEKKIPGPRPKKGKDQGDEDLVLFKEVHRQERASAISLLQADSMEFESTGNYQFYRQSSGRKGYEFLTDSGKNDYDWLKTPPATPLFPSLEMEAGINAPEFVAQREIPILQPLSRFSGNPITSEKSNSVGKSKSPKPDPIPENLLVVPNVKVRLIRTSVTPPNTKANRSIRTSVTQPEAKANSTKVKNTTMPIMQKTNHQTSTTSKKASTAPTASKVSAKPIYQQQQQQQQKKLKNPNLDFLASNLSKSMRQELSEPKKSKPRSRGVSPLVRSSKNLTGISDETPPNLEADRSLSATHDRSVNRTRRTETTPLKRENNNLRTQSRSASVSSIRRVETKQETNKIQTTVGGGNGTQILGSRMVDRLMNARKLSTTSATTIVEGRETRTKQINLRASLNEESGFGRTMSKSPLDGAFKNMELR